MSSRLQSELCLRSLRLVLLRRAWTMKSLAKRLGVEQSTIYRSCQAEGDKKLVWQIERFFDEPIYDTPASSLY